MEWQHVILVDEQDRPVGTMEKMAAHEKGLLHRAFSIFIFNCRGDMLLQQRAQKKYHSGGLWTNACCSHPQPGQTTLQAATWRLKDEMGFTTPVKKIFDFVYRFSFDNGLTEHEFDHVFAGEYEGPVDFNREEVCDFRYSSMKELHDSLQNHPHEYTAWFQLAFPKVESWWKERYNNSSV